jgi:DNA-binding GntR family transcriptional regulator
MAVTGTRLLLLEVTRRFIVCRRTTNSVIASDLMGCQFPGAEMLGKQNITRLPNAVASPIGPQGSDFIAASFASKLKTPCCRHYVDRLDWVILPESQSSVAAGQLRMEKLMARQAQEVPAQKETGAVRVYGVLRDEILTMKLPPGAPLDEIGLADRFDLSRSPIREALVRLSADGLVSMLPNRSTVVTPMDFRRIPEFLDALDLLQRVTHRLAALHRTPADMVAIRAAQKGYEKGIASSIKSGTSQAMIEKNYEFHMAIAQAGQNVYFADLYRRLLDEGRRMLHLHFEFQTLDEHLTAEEISSDHVEIVNAIDSRNADMAEHYAHLHAAQFKGRFMQFLDRNITAGVQLSYPSSVV